MQTTMSIKTKKITEWAAAKLLGMAEGHFFDVKATAIKPAKLTKTIAAFANADGGELLIGIDDAKSTSSGKPEWNGFSQEEDANGHLQVFEELFPLSRDFEYEFLECDGRPGLVLRITISKTQDIKRASDKVVYLRRGAQGLPVKSSEALANLERAKGITTHEDATLAVPPDGVVESDEIKAFMKQVVPEQQPKKWLKKQRLIVDDKPTVAGCVLFADEPQVYLPKAAVKIYRYKTSDAEGTRDTLAFNPKTIEGPLYDLIKQTVKRTVELTEQIEILTDTGMQRIKYPPEALHEVITNSVLHRDYALNDDVHVRIFDNRIEVESPGRLPAHITPKNILDERYARNPKLVRLVNKYPDPPNKDVGEGLNTAFRAMKKLRLRDPEIVEKENAVLVMIRHEQLASPQQQILAHLRKHTTINNSKARDVTGIQSEVKVRKILKDLVEAGEIEQVPGTARSTSAYRIPAHRR